MLVLYNINFRLSNLLRSKRGLSTIPWDNSNVGGEFLLYKVGCRGTESPSISTAHYLVQHRTPRYSLPRRLTTARTVVRHDRADPPLSISRLSSQFNPVQFGPIQITSCKVIHRLCATDVCAVITSAQQVIRSFARGDRITPVC